VAEWALRDADLADWPAGFHLQLAVETTETQDRTTKLALCGAHGLKHVWRLSPIACTLEVFRLETLDWFRFAAYAKDEVVRSGPFDAVELNLGLLWPEGVEPEQEG
jgi:hypothetical protein